MAEDRSWCPVFETQAIARLGEGLRERGSLGEEAMERAVAVVADFCGQARRLGAGEILIVGTSAVRDAANRPAFLERLRQAAGKPVWVVPGEDEGRLTLLGVLHGLPALSGSLLVFDIGGGSTEFILAREGEPIQVRSLALGVVPLAERFRTVEPVAPGRYTELAQEIRAMLGEELGDLLAAPRPDYLVGTAGTVTTLAALDQALPAYDPARVHGSRLLRARIEALRATLNPLPASARAARPCLEPGRADLIVPGIAICLATMEAFGFDSLTVSDFGLREGIIVEHLGGTW